MTAWTIRLRGGAFDGFEGESKLTPGNVVVAWDCGGRGCQGHATLSAHDPDIVLRTAETYTRVEFDETAHLAVYEIGERVPGLEMDERELVGAGAGDLAAVRQVAERWGLRTSSR